MAWAGVMWDGMAWKWPLKSMGAGLRQASLISTYPLPNETITKEHSLRRIFCSITKGPFSNPQIFWRSNNERILLMKYFLTTLCATLVLLLSLQTADAGTSRHEAIMSAEIICFDNSLDEQFDPDCSTLLTLLKPNANDKQAAKEERVRILKQLKLLLDIIRK